ncbi:MAG: hypothetical protein AAF242_08820 [Bacteroidota bacterium]
MKKLFSFLLLVCLSYNLLAQYDYEPSKEYPYGRLNPEAPEAIADYAALIGKCNCEYTQRNQQGNWGEPANMTWIFKYIMNGMAVQDETLKPDGIHSGSIRQYNVDSSKWYVHYYTMAANPASLPSWEGGKDDNGNIVLYNEQIAPNGMEGFYKIIFSDISVTGFNWQGAWVNPKETIVYPLFKITCKKTP